MAARVGISQSRVSRIELGLQSVPIAVVERWADATGAAGTTRAQVMELADAAATQAIAWRKAMTRGLVTLQRDSRDLEASATSILNFQSAYVPGLLQVPEYSRRVFAAGHPPPSQQEVAAATAVRMDRQVILYDESKSFEFVLAEAALRWRLGPASLMRAQLDRIIAVSALSNVTICVIPLSAEVNEWHDHGFNILQDRSDAQDPVVHVETFTTGLTLTEPDDVAAYQGVFRRLKDAAVSGDETTELMREIARNI
jgi:transcriptional regulator with XRE-family HTH domain